MTEYMLYLSHNTISYHFDITQMLISSTIIFFFFLANKFIITYQFLYRFYLLLLLLGGTVQKLLFYLVVEVVFMSFTVYAFLRLFFLCVILAHNFHLLLLKIFLEAFSCFLVSHFYYYNTPLSLFLFLFFSGGGVLNSTYICTYSAYNVMNENEIFVSRKVPFIVSCALSYDFIHKM